MATLETQPPVRIGTMQTIVDAIKVAHFLVNEQLRIKPGEEVMIACDTMTEMEILHALAGAIQAAGADFTICIQPSREPKDASKLTKVIQRAAGAADVYIAWSNSCGAALYSSREKKTGQKVFAAPMRTLEVFLGPAATSDYKYISDICLNLKKLLDGTKTIRVTSAIGTDMIWDVTGMPWEFEDGGILGHAAFGDGEVFTSHTGHSADGIVYIDGPLAYIGVPDEPIKLTVEKGWITNVEGGKSAAELRKVFEQIPNSNYMCEFAIGVNPWSRRSRFFEEEKKGLNNIHTAYGGLPYFFHEVMRTNVGEKEFEKRIAKIHADMISYDVTIWADDNMIEDKGNPVGGWFYPHPQQNLHDDGRDADPG
jgi:leucyl aminopeptidase (aminopeptidase T)